MAMKRNSEEKVVSKWTLVSAFIMLLVTIIALTTATYAWFTSNTTVDLGDLDVNVTATSGIQVSMDATTWKASLTTADIQGGMYLNASNERIDVNQIPKTLAAVSTAGTVSAGKMLFYKGDISKDANSGSFLLTSTSTVEAAGARPYSEDGDNGDFIAFDMFIQTPTKVKLSLTAGSTVEYNQTGNSGLQNATRVAFVAMGTKATPMEARTDVIPATGKTKIWEPNADAHTQEGINNAITYGISNLTNGTPINSYYGLNSAFATGVALNNTGAGFAQVSGTLKTNAASEGREDVELFELDPGITKVRVYCWIEGQDVDCEDKVSGSGIKFNISLNKTDVVVEPED